MNRKPTAVPATTAMALLLAGCATSGTARPAASGGPDPGPAVTAVTTPAGGGAAPVGPSSGSGVHLTESNPPGDIPDRQVYVPFAPPGAHFRVRIPEGWARSVAGTGVRFTDKLNTITMEEVAAATAPTTTSVTATVLPELRRQVPAFAPGAVTATRRAAGPAVLVSYTGDSAPDPVTNRVVRDAFERYAFWHNGYQVVVTLSGPTGADNVDPWKTVTDSLRWQ